MNKFASGKHAKGTCDVCGFTTKMNALKALIVKGKTTGVLACEPCWVPDHPQLHIGERKVVDAQSLRRPRPDVSREASRNIAWGWNPICGAAAVSEIGQVTV